MSTSAGSDRRSPGQADEGGKDSAEEPPRVKRWAPRSRTGCLGCRARRVKCDEIRPKCKSCQKRNMECRYELNPPGADSSSNALPKPSISIRPKPAATGRHDNSAGSVKRDESPRACRRCPCSGLLSPEPEALCGPGEPSYHDTALTVTDSSGRRLPSSTSRALSMRCQRRKPDSRGQEAALVADIHPPDWYYSEAVTYFNTYLLGKIKKFEVIPINYHRPLGKNVANFDAFIAFILAHRITEISRDRGSPVQPSEAYHTKHLWERLYTCISNQITCINNEIARPNSGDAARVRVLTRIQGIKCVELMLQSPIWRNHMEGFLSLLRYCGGLKFARGREALIRSIKGMIMESVLANSVAPASDQIVGTSYFTTEELLFFHNQILHPTFPCPGVLFAKILETNNLRVQMHSNPSLGYFTDALNILQRIDAFQPTAWKESAYTLPQIPEVPLMASIYQLSVGLFCLMALQYAGLGSMDKAERRSSLLGLLRTAWSLEHCRDALNWPLAVVGCALADGGTPAERAFVCNCLEDAAQHVFAVHPLPIMSKLEQFWASGMTHWDKCWGEPFPIVG